MAKTGPKYAVPAGYLKSSTIPWSKEKLIHRADSNSAEAFVSAWRGGLKMTVDA